MNRAARIALAFLLLLPLVQCSGWLPPFETVAPAPPAGEEASLRVGICYNALTASTDQVRDVAVRSCGPGSNPQRIGQALNMQNCPVLIPERAVFTCTVP